jgi:hypothetical protein
MDTTTLGIIVAVTGVIIIALVVYRYGRGFALKLKGWGVQAELQAEGEEHIAKAPASSRNVSIGGDATHNLVVTGDSIAGKRPTMTGAGRNVSIGGSAQDNVIVTGDGNKMGQ